MLDITKRHVALLTDGLRSIIEETIIRRDLWDAEDVKYEDGGTNVFFAAQSSPADIPHLSLRDWPLRFAESILDKVAAARGQSFDRRVVSWGSQCCRRVSARGQTRPSFENRVVFT